jgi:hypothetical protein
VSFHKNPHRGLETEALRKEVFAMSIFGRAQQSANSFVQSIAMDGNKLEKKEGGLMTAFENNAREVLLLSVSLILLLFNMLEGRTRRLPR